MNHVERFRAVMNFQQVDRLPRWEWAMWWDETIKRWHGEGLPVDIIDIFEIHKYFGLDPYKQFWYSTTDATIEAVQHHVEGIVHNMDDYMKLRPNLYPDHSKAIEEMSPWFEKQKQGQAVIWITLEGYFWFSRTLMGFTDLMLAFYDQPELIHKINKDLLEFNLGLLEQIGRIGKPTFMTIAEDMSYNNGPMISRAAMDNFMSPYYEKMLAAAFILPGDRERLNLLIPTGIGKEDFAEKIMEAVKKRKEDEELEGELTEMVDSDDNDMDDIIQDIEDLEDI